MSAALPEVPAARIWDAAPHCAFPDLARFRGLFLCCFREAQDHMTRGGPGRVRVIASEDGGSWSSVALLAEDGVDLRDPKLSVTPEGRLMLLMGGSVHDVEQGVRTLRWRAPRVAFSDERCEAFSEPQPVRIDPAVASGNDWLWRATWRGGEAFGVLYQPSPRGSAAPWGLVLVGSRDGLAWELVQRLDVGGAPNETTLRFLPDGRMVALVRRDGGDPTGLVGHARPPYRDWTWRSLGRRLGGPDFLVLPDGALVCGTRSHDAGCTSTILARFDLEGGFRPLVRLPGGGDTGYPGLVLHGEELWVGYYAGHGAGTAIHLARVPLAALAAG